MGWKEEVVVEEERGMSTPRGQNASRPDIFPFDQARGRHDSIIPPSLPLISRHAHSPFPRILFASAR